MGLSTTHVLCRALAGAMVVLSACSLDPSGLGSTTDSSAAASTGGAASASASTSGGGSGGAGPSSSSIGSGGGDGGGPDGLPISCATLPRQAPDGIYAINLGATDPPKRFEVYCDQTRDGGGWALLFNSVGDPQGQTTGFWNIAYAARLDVKGTAGLDTNLYSGNLYGYAHEFRDEIEDVSGKVATAAIVTITGIDHASMKLVGAALVSGSATVFNSHFAAGWSAPDFDQDPDPQNCAALWANVTQHYASCWMYNLGAGLVGPPYDDSGWGPHVVPSQLTALGLSLARQGDTSRVQRISRWARW